MKVVQWQDPGLYAFLRGSLGPPGLMANILRYAATDTSKMGLDEYVPHMVLLGRTCSELDGVLANRNVGDDILYYMRVLEPNEDARRRVVDRLGADAELALAAVAALKQELDSIVVPDIATRIRHDCKAKSPIGFASLYCEPKDPKDKRTVPDYQAIIVSSNWRTMAYRRGHLHTKQAPAHFVKILHICQGTVH